MRVDQTDLNSQLGPPEVSFGAPTGFHQVPTLVWAIPQTGGRITIHPDDTWKSSEIARLDDLSRRRMVALARGDEEARRLIGNQPLEIGSVTFSEWRLTDNSNGSVWFGESGVMLKCDSETTLKWVRQNARYFAGIGLAVAP
jgi:hypothetical protein